MFEGKPPHPGELRPLDVELGGGEDLRPLNWNELVARLSAARELRAGLRPQAGGAEGSFDAGSARLIAAQHNGKHPVNLEDSGNGKDDQGTAQRVVHEAGLGAQPGAARE